MATVLSFLCGLMLTLQVLAVLSQSPSDGEDNLCANAETCGECIRTTSVCAWCKAEKFDINRPRCDHFQHLRDVCAKDDLVYPVHKYKVITDKEVRGGSETRQAIQVQPQEINVKARINEPVTLTVKFRQAENYPVDLYFLLDMSYSMLREVGARDNLLTLGEAMAVSMSNITKDFRLGFGSFVDKVTMPFIAWTPQMLSTLCPEGQSCRDPHDFKNQQTLTQDMKLFKRNMKVALETMSQSTDDPEGGLDAFAQALACEEALGWRARSRRIIVYSSNSYFHMAGDGKLAGAVKPFDGLCHLDKRGVYADWDKILDYPSVSQLAGLVKQKKANVVFVVMGSVFDLYKELANHLEGAVIGKLADDSNNIIQLVQDNYNKLRSKITLNPEKADDIKFVFRSKCKGKVLRETNECEGLEIGDSVYFNVTMTALSCSQKKRAVEITAVGLAEKLKINLELICSCDCEQPLKAQKDSPKCSNGNGTFECGKCRCNKDRYGRVCECDETELSNYQSIENCKANPNATAVCSAKGECVCGECKCLPIKINTARRYSGKFCECNDYDCDYYDGMLCGGPSRGQCICGTCVCNSDYTGNDCSCSTRIDTCQASNGVICNDQGTCECGRCKCNAEDGYRGPTCEDCPTCPTKCNAYLACAQCVGFGTGEYNAELCEKQCQGVTIVSKVKEELPDVKLCRNTDVDNCLFFYTYEYDEDNKPVIKVQRTKKCPEEAPTVKIVGGIVGGIVLIGLLAILLFIFIRRRQDAKEYAEFMKEKERARWESAGNPIYKDPKSTFKNPTYTGR